MRTFRCQCGNTLYFENRYCLACQRDTGFLPDALQLSVLQPVDQQISMALLNAQSYRRCQNYAQFDVCNWMVPAADDHAYCQSCRLNQLIPNLGEARNLTLWRRIESAKRRLLFTLYRLRLPVVSHVEEPQTGLAFEFVRGADSTHDEFNNVMTGRGSVRTGHTAGTITINLLEAEPSAREEMRARMNERYRTLLGHFRHEIGHYYWDRLIKDTGWLDPFRQLFGDERVDYPLALRNYYASGPLANWQNTWISPYASSHPWEDWAETWAHYLHMVDTLETAHDYAFSIRGVSIQAPVSAGQWEAASVAEASLDELLADWERLSVALNSLNRSMGLEDAYPFVVTGAVLDKLSFVHRLIQQTAAR